MIRRIKSDSNLKKFIEFCKQRYGKNLIVIGIYGSYALGYFDKDKSDYDVFLFFNSKVRNETKFLDNKFKKISVLQFCSSKELFELIKKGHWAIYITLLTSARMLYYSREYEILIKKLKKINFINNLNNFNRIKWKIGFDKRNIKKGKGYSGAKYTLPALRSNLQLLTYIKYKKSIWDLKKIVKLNKDILTREEQEFLIQLEKSVKRRKNFNNKKIAINILEKIKENIF